MSKARDGIRAGGIIIAIIGLFVVQNAASMESAIIGILVTVIGAAVAVLS